MNTCKLKSDKKGTPLKFVRHGKVSVAVWESDKSMSTIPPEAFERNYEIIKEEKET